MDLSETGWESVGVEITMTEATLYSIGKDLAIRIYDSKCWETWDKIQIGMFQLFISEKCIPTRVFEDALESKFNHNAFYPGCTLFGLQYKFLCGEEPPTLKQLLEYVPTQILNPRQYANIEIEVNPDFYRIKDYAIGTEYGFTDRTTIEEVLQIVKHDLEQRKIQPIKKEPVQSDGLDLNGPYDRLYYSDNGEK